MKRISFVKSLQVYLQRNYGIAKPASKLSNEDIRKKRNLIFDEERARQQSLITRVEKIEVSVKGEPEECTLIMNKDLSTPFECGKHIGEIVTSRAVLAQVNGKLWDMHRPLTESCELKFLHFKQNDPYYVNKAFWRSCSFLLGLLAEKVFRDSFYVEVHSWPSPNIRSGSFICDADLKIKEWNPSQEELNILTTTILKICREGHKFEHMEVDASVALRIFEDNRFKKQQIPKISSQSADGNTLTLYRVSDHIDVSRGPMIANTNIISKYTVAAVHRIHTKDGILYRLQGVALPHQLPLNSFAYNILVKRAMKMVAVPHHY